MFSALARLRHDDRKKHGEEVSAVSSVTLGRPFCSASYLFWSFPALQPFHIASKCTLFFHFYLFFCPKEAVKDSASSQSISEVHYFCHGENWVCSSNSEGQMWCISTQLVWCCFGPAWSYQSVCWYWICFVFLNLSTFLKSTKCFR